MSVEGHERTSRANSAAVPGFVRKPRRSKYGNHEQKSTISGSMFPNGETQNVSYLAAQRHDPLGLHLVCDVKDPTGDIIFVHGLGGTAKKTWAWERNMEHFWPIWLADEDELSTFRIFTFGYNSNFKGSGTNLSILDFAKDLLFQMLTFAGGSEGECVPIGSRAIIFVAHSMGGLVVKKAYILGKHDPNYASLISQVFGIIFLGTPHRGAQYAKVLNNILSTAPLGAPPKAYVADLTTQSPALQDINEQFRTACEGLALISFFETLKTSIGVTKILVRPFRSPQPK